MFLDVVLSVTFIFHFSFPVSDLVSCLVLYPVLQGKQCAFVCTEQGFGADSIRAVFDPVRWRRRS